MLEENGAERGAAKRGPTLLAGLLRCGRCGRKLHVNYRVTAPPVWPGWRHTPVWNGREVIKAQHEY